MQFILVRYFNFCSSYAKNGSTAGDMSAEEEIGKKIEPFHADLVTAELQAAYYRERGQEYEVAAKAIGIEKQKPWITGGNWLIFENLTAHEKQMQKKAAEYQQQAADITKSFAVYVSTRKLCVDHHFRRTPRISIHNVFDVMTEK
ncbi:unnamed protein product [Amoebophrya sp. A120]|nr:unnamed protein product [Amoebophrya sp. A120]|eukprot:GSA120T00020455001.1